MDKLIGKEVDALRPINLFDLKVIPTFYVQRDRVHTFMHDVCVSRSVCTYDSTHLDQMQVCVYMMTKCASRLDSYSHTVYEMMNDDESLDQTYYMCDVSRLDSYNIMNISTRKNYQTSTSFYVRIPRNLCP